MELQYYIGKIQGPDCRVEISDSNELCIVELTRVDCILLWKNLAIVSDQVCY